MLAFLKRAVRAILPRRAVTWVQERRNPHIDEVAWIASVAPGRGVMVDVGAHHGSCTQRFLDKGWRVVAYEPDPRNRAVFEARIKPSKRLDLSSNAVSDKAASGLNLFSSDVSTGISGLSAFHESHRPTATVDAVTLAEDLPRRGVDRVDFLKIDVEGFDFFALKGFDWSLRPRFALYEFENRKTAPLGYTLDDSTAFMADRGYHLLYSVWEPIVEYGRDHTWRGLFRQPPADASDCWGNVLCFREEADRDRLERRVSTRR